MTQGRALVTGAGHRLGRAMTLQLAARGIDVAIHYASAEAAARETAAEARRHGVKAETLRADLLIEADVESLVTRAASTLGGPLDLLVNNASIFERDTLGSITRQSWDRHMDSNLRAPVMLTQAFASQAPDAARDAQGEPLASALVVNMIDQRVHKLTPDFMSYTLAKSALWTFTRTAAQALAPRIRVNAIGPSPTLRGPRQTEAQFARQRAATPLQRGAGSADIAAALCYLLDAKAVTGQMICVDGGQHLAWQTPDVMGTE